ncbi:MAG: hypothetical protein COW27_00085 [Nitrosopumilales archaeon CG15_BIG_FIL_POST_REV_8_21_14_020_37_12]|nr:MAG: hypothetical protein COW27_00085 [Nitrosopumilales archaeon CG15_BIG_FIL_POST_REV_8_21_14_020_37_12]
MFQPSITKRQMLGMEYNEIYCNNCKKVVGRYNVKFYNEDKVGELIKTSHETHVKNGHHLVIRKFEK